MTANPRPSLEAIRALFAQVRRNPEAALALRLDPGCVPVLADPPQCARSGRRSGSSAGCDDDGRREFPQGVFSGEWFRRCEV